MQSLSKTIFSPDPEPKKEEKLIVIVSSRTSQSKMLPQSKIFLFGILFHSALVFTPTFAGRKDSSDLQTEASENNAAYSQPPSAPEAAQPQSRQDYAAVPASAESYTGPTEIFMGRPVTYVPPQVTFNPPRLIYKKPTITHASDSSLVSVPSSSKYSDQLNPSGYSPPPSEDSKQVSPMQGYQVLQYQQSPPPSNTQSAPAPQQQYQFISYKPTSPSGNQDSSSQQYQPAQAQGKPSPQQTSNNGQMHIFQYQPSQTQAPKAEPAAPPQQQIMQYRFTPSDALTNNSSSSSTSSWSKVDALPPSAYSYTPSGYSAPPTPSYATPQPPAGYYAPQPPAGYSVPPAPSSYSPPPPPPPNNYTPPTSYSPPPSYQPNPNAPAEKENVTVGIDDVLTVLTKYFRTTSQQWSEAFTNQINQMNYGKQENASTPAPPASPPTLHPGWTQPPPGWSAYPGWGPYLPPPPPPPIYYQPAPPPTTTPAPAPPPPAYQPPPQAQAPPSPQQFVYPMPMMVPLMMPQQQAQSQSQSAGAAAAAAPTQLAAASSQSIKVRLPEKRTNEVESEYVFECEEDKKK